MLNVGKYTIAGSYGIGNKDSGANCLGKKSQSIPLPKMCFFRNLGESDPKKATIIYEGIGQIPAVCTCLHQLVTVPVSLVH